MRQTRYAFAATCLALSVSQVAHAAAFQLYELGTPIVGTADVGQAVVTTDASATYFNPAAMTQLTHSAFLLGSQMILPYANFSSSTRSTISGDNGGNAGSLTPGLGLFYVYSYTPKLKFGISLTSPYGGLLNYNDSWKGRYVVQSMQFYTININPTFAYQLNPLFSIGGGIAAEYANLNQRVALRISSTNDAQANIKVDNYSGGVNLGALFTPSASTKLGIAYRSKVVHSLSGTTSFTELSYVPNTTSRLVMPHNVIISGSQLLTDRFTLLGELGWANWATMKNTIVTIDGFSASTPRDWRNTYRLGVAGEFAVNDAWRVHAGTSYDSSPTSAGYRLPDLPMDRQIRVGAGFVYAVLKAADLGFSYEYVDLGRANINNNSAYGALVGSYSRNNMNVFQASVNVNLA